MQVIDVKRVSFLCYRDMHPDWLIFCCFVGKVMPKYYYVPPQNLKQELKEPGSMIRYPNEGYEENIFLWGQSLYIMANILRK